MVWRLGENGFLPQIRGQVGVGLCNGSISCLGCKVWKRKLVFWTDLNLMGYKSSNWTGLSSES